MPDPRDVSVNELLHRIVCALVDTPDAVKVEIQSDEDNYVTFGVRTHPLDIGKVIGKQGRTARSLRTILEVAAARGHRRYLLDIQRVSERADP